MNEKSKPNLSDLIRLHEEGHGCRIIHSQYSTERGLHDIMCVPLVVGERGELFINAWNCVPTLVHDDHLHDDVDLPDDLVSIIVEWENGGALNISGNYYPMTEESYYKLAALLDQSKVKCPRKEGDEE